MASAALMTTVHAAVAHPHATHGDASHSAGRPAATSVAASDAATSFPVVADIAAANAAAAPTTAAGSADARGDPAVVGSNPAAYRDGNDDDDAPRGFGPSNRVRPEPEHEPEPEPAEAPAEAFSFSFSFSFSPAAPARDFRIFCIHSVGAKPPSSLSSNDDDAARSDSGIGIQYSAANSSENADAFSFGFASRRDWTLATSGEGNDDRAAFADDQTPPEAVRTPSNVRLWSFRSVCAETTTDRSVSFFSVVFSVVRWWFASVGGALGFAVSAHGPRRCVAGCTRPFGVL